MEYVRLTDDLIREVQEQGIDTVFFLDKSARPVAWLFRSLWPLMAEKGEDGAAVPMPKINFLNIDRELLGKVTGRSEDSEGGMDVGRVDELQVESLRETYPRVEAQDVAHDETGEEGVSKLLVVDEMRASGDTLAMAVGLLGRAFPASQVKGTHWMMPSAKTGLAPVWYSAATSKGRLVSDTNPAASLLSPSPAQRRGALWLSTRPQEPDVAGVQLRAEATMIADEIRRGELPVYPSIQRDDFEERVWRFNGMSPREFAALREKAAKMGRGVVALWQRQRSK